MTVYKLAQALRELDHVTEGRAIYEDTLLDTVANHLVKNISDIATCTLITIYRTPHVLNLTNLKRSYGIEVTLSPEDDNSVVFGVLHTKLGDIAFG